MKNRIAGYIVLGIAALIGIIILLFNRALANMISTSCSHGYSCPMWGSLSFYTNLSILLMCIVAGVGVYLIFFGREEKIITRIKKVHEQIKPEDIKRENYAKLLTKLKPAEKIILEHVIDAKGTLLQSKLVSETGFTKVKITRLLDKLEGMNIIERKRRGMSNIVLLKHH
jgi:uncharacterized membrane protein